MFWILFALYYVIGVFVIIWDMTKTQDVGIGSFIFTLVLFWSIWPFTVIFDWILIPLFKTIVFSDVIIFKKRK